MLWLTINDDTGSFIDAECIKAVVCAGDGSSIIVDCDGASVGSPLSPKELRGRIESLLQRATN